MTLDTLQPFEQSFTVSPPQPTATTTEAAATIATIPSSSSLSSSTTVATDENYLLETFHQYPHGDFRPTFYNPFEIKHRRRTSRAQLKVLEKSYMENPKPSASIRRILAQKLEMTPRGVQIWFQNRRAKAKLLRRKLGKTTTTTAAPITVKRSKLEEDNEDEDEEEEEYNDEDENAAGQIQHFNNLETFDTACTDINQSSILFSQFFTSNFIAPIAPPAAVEENDWSILQVNNNVRTVATTAAAVAAASSSCQQYDMRRNSCPIVSHLQQQQEHMNMALRQPLPQQQANYLSPVWSPLLISRNYNNGINSVSPMQQQQPSYKRNFSYDANTGFDIMNHHYSQHTPPLTASCSASTAAGSPISLDNLYMNDPVVLPNQYYSNSNQHATSPLASTTYITDYMSQFI